MMVRIQFSDEMSVTFRWWAWWHFCWSTYAALAQERRRKIAFSKLNEHGNLCNWFIDVRLDGKKGEFCTSMDLRLIWTYSATQLYQSRVRHVRRSTTQTTYLKVSSFSYEVTVTALLVSWEVDPSPAAPLRKQFPLYHGGKAVALVV